jgi:hypothetical protein
MYKRIQEQILKRDGYKCIKCGATEDTATLVVHHLDKTGQSKKPNNKLENLVTLCKACHIKEHAEDYLKIRRENSANRWSLEYDCCVECGTTETPYNGHGLCDNCYARWLRKQPKAHNKRWAPNYDKCVVCGTTKVPHQSQGMCHSCYTKEYRKKPRKTWSKKYESCIICHTTDRPYQARGMCRYCYLKWQRGQL